MGQHRKAEEEAPFIRRIRIFYIYIHVHTRLRHGCMYLQQVFESLEIRRYLSLSC